MSADLRLLSGKFSGFIVMLHKGATEVMTRTYGCPTGSLCDFLLVQTATGTGLPLPAAAGRAEPAPLPHPNAIKCLTGFFSEPSR